MIEWLSKFWATTTWGEILLGAAVIGASVLLSFAVVSFVMVKIPATYFHSGHQHHFLSDKHPLFRGVAIVGKNILGVFLIVLGVILVLPGIPGPGFLTIFIGLILTDIPGKRGLEARIIRRPFILAAVNKLRLKYNKPELELN